MTNIAIIFAIASLVSLVSGNCLVLLGLYPDSNSTFFKFPVGLIILSISTVVFAFCLNYIGYPHLLFVALYWAWIIGFGVAAVLIFNAGQYGLASLVTLFVCALNGTIAFFNYKDFFWMVPIVNFIYLSIFVGVRLWDFKR